MHINQMVRLTVLTLLGILLVAAAAHAQAIAGVVTDTSGAVLPGVTVEVSSPALIERARSVVTDGTGRYNIIALMPGTYTVTFTLTGFTIVKRGGIELVSSFTAPVNAELKVGTVEESVLVTGETPLVDLQGTVAQSVLTRKVIDAIPSGRDIFGYGLLIPGVTVSGLPDVGGSQSMQSVTLQVHGSNTRDMMYTQDGMTINDNFAGGNQAGYYYNDGGVEEYDFQTSALPAEQGIGGVAINMVTKQGGNDFHGSVFSSGANNSMQSNNLTDEMKNRGMTIQNKIKDIYDVNLSLGGPIKRDRLWFFTTFRRWGADEPVANTFNKDGTQALNDFRLTNWTGRASVALNKKNKFTFSYDYPSKYRGHRRDNQPATFVSPEAALVQTTGASYLTQAKWTSTLTDKLLIQAGFSALKVYSIYGYQPGTQPTDYTHYDVAQSILTNAAIYAHSEMNTPKVWVASLSYVTGHHNLKIGGQIRYGPETDWTAKNGDIMLQYNNGVPFSVVEYNTPVTPTANVNADDAIYAQDSWTTKRLTVNAGVRFDYYKSSIPAQTSAAGTWVPTRSFPAEPVDVFKNVVPRLGGAYDLFGNGKTAVKASASEYVGGEGVTLAQTLNPNGSASRTCPWTDPSHDNIPQLSEIGACGPYSGGVTTRIDPNLTRPLQWEYVGQLQQQVRPGFSVTVAYFHRRFFNNYGAINVAVPASGYTPVTITNPVDNTPFTIYNQSKATFGLQDSLLTNLPHLTNTYNGFEVKFDKRFANGTVFGGFTVGRDRGNSSANLNDPNTQINAVGMIGSDATYQMNAAGTYRFPLGIESSLALRAATGLPLTRTYTVTRAVVPTLTQVSVSVNVAPRGFVRLPSTSILDLRLAKVFKGARTKGASIQAVADIFNLLNSSANTGEVTAVGPALGTPSSLLDARFARIGLQVKF
jgi:Carboxypeptidase regulatory-like domain